MVQRFLKPYGDLVSDGELKEKVPVPVQSVDMNKDGRCFAPFLLLHNGEAKISGDIFSNQSRAAAIWNSFPHGPSPSGEQNLTVSHYVSPTFKNIQ